MSRVRVLPPLPRIRKAWDRTYVLLGLVDETKRATWELRGRRFAGYRFRRQHPFEPYILDFFYAACSLVIELDGESHLGNESADRRRQQFLEEAGRSDDVIITHIDGRIMTAFIGARMSGRQSQLLSRATCRC